MEDQDKWDKRYITLAKQAASWSKDPSTKTGAVLTNNNRVIGIGYNGFPEKIADNYRLENRSMKYEIIIHCEINAVLSSSLDKVCGATLYTWPFLSCSRCAAVMIQLGISRTVAPRNTIDRWEENLILSRALFNEAGVLIREVG